MKCALMLVLVCGGVASAQTVTLRNLVSSDGGNTWSPSVVVTPGTTVFVQVQAVITGGTPLGLAGFTMQPTLSNWDALGGDSRNAFTFPGVQSVNGLPQTESGYVGRPVIDVPGATGRLHPYGAGAQGDESSSGIVTSFNDPGNVLRFAGSRNVTPTTNTAWGIVISQFPRDFIGTMFSTSLTPVVFRYSVTLGSSNFSERTLVADVPLAIMNRSGRTTWYLNDAGTMTLAINANPIEQGFIHVIPAPTTCGIIMLACATMGVRRRRARE
jgi:hypothetical protein